MKFLLACLLSAPLIHFIPAQQAQTPSHLNNVAASTKVRTVQAELPRKEVTGVVVKAEAQEKAPTEPVGAPLHTQLSSHESLMQQAGIPRTDWAAVDYIVSHESSWRPTKWNESGSGAYGLCQALPASKMASAGTDYMSNPVTQLRWCSQYAVHRYGGWWASFAFWKAERWW